MNTFLVTTGTVGGVEIIDAIPNTGNPKIELVKIVIQGIIALIGFIKLVKKPKVQPLNK